MSTIPQETQRYVDMLCGADVPVFQTCLDDKNQQDKGTFRFGQLETLWPWLQEQQRLGHGVFLTVNQTRGGRSEDDVTKVRALYVEFDQQQRPPASWHLPPSMVVQSANGLHVYWLLHSGTSVAQCREGLARLISYYNSDPRIRDACRVLRVPGTVHQKAKPGQSPQPFVVKLLDASGHRYTYDQVVSPLPQTSSAPKQTRTLAQVVQGGELEQALADIATWPTPVSKAEGGSGRNKYQTYCRLINDYALTEDELWTAARAWGDKCVPPVKDEELDEELDHALRYNKGFKSYEVVERARQRERDAAVSDSWGSLQQWAKKVAIPEPDLGDAPASPPAADKPKRGRPPGVLLTDTDVAMQVKEHFEQDLRYAAGLGWHVWNGKHWETDETRKRTEIIFDVVQRLERSAPDKKAFVAAKRYENMSNLSSVERRLESLPGIAVKATDVNQNPWILVHTAGTADLHTGATLPHRREDLSTMCAPTAPVRNPGGPWDVFLQTVLPKQDLRDFVQRAVGCSIVGNQQEHAWFMCTGGGGNGKGTFLRALQEALGPYCGVLPSNFFIATPNERHATETMSLFGKRLVASAELPSDKAMDESKVKALSGGDAITARFIAKDFVTFQPTHNIWVFCNNKPRVKSVDQGFWRRANVIPFEVTIPKAAMDKQLDSKLKADAGAVLAWAIEGARLYLAGGLGTSQTVDEATADYKEEQDFFGQFIKELFDADKDARVGTTVFRDALQRYYNAEGQDYLPTNPWIMQALTARGFKVVRVTSGERMWHGLRIKDIVYKKLQQETAAQIPIRRAA